MNYGLFKQPKKAVRVARAECLNADMGIISLMRASEDQRNYAVVLCLANKTEKTNFKCEANALSLMDKYKQQYKTK